MLMKIHLTFKFNESGYTCQITQGDLPANLHHIHIQNRPIFVRHGPSNIPYVGDFSQNQNSPTHSLHLHNFRHYMSSFSPVVTCWVFMSM